jgi:hypothetical protein
MQSIPFDQQLLDRMIVPTMFSDIEQLGVDGDEEDVGIRKERGHEGRGGEVVGVFGLVE